MEKQKVTKTPDFKISKVKPTTLSLVSNKNEPFDNGVVTTTSSWKENDEKLTSENDTRSKFVAVEKNLEGAENSTEFVDLIKVNLTTSVQEVVPKVNSCSPLLTQLFSGKPRVSYKKSIFIDVST